jgi:hypothetical protein
MPVIASSRDTAKKLTTALTGSILTRVSSKTDRRSASSVLLSFEKLYTRGASKRENFSPGNY